MRCSIDALHRFVSSEARPRATRVLPPQTHLAVKFLAELVRRSIHISVLGLEIRSEIMDEPPQRASMSANIDDRGHSSQPHFVLQ